MDAEVRNFKRRAPLTDAQRDLAANHVSRLGFLVSCVCKQTRVPRAFDLDELLEAAGYGLTLAVQSFDPRKGRTLRSWISFKIAHEIHEYIRSEARDRIETLGNRVKGLAAPCDQRDDVRAGLPAVVEAALFALSPRQREAATLRWCADLDWSAVRQRMGVSDGSIHVHLEAAREKLRELLREHREVA